ncbi:MAG: squalene/phytoene synthase family protein [Phycisphaerales bacterium]
MSLVASLLERTSRTFALSIPMLPMPTQREIAVAYLLFRVADTFEDEPWWDLPERIEGLRGLAIAVGDHASEHNFTPPAPRAGVETHDGYAELLDQSSAVLGAWRELDPDAARSIAKHLIRTIDGMAAHLERGQAPRTIPEVQRYCYYVAGIVGELCTDLFWRAAPEGAPPRARAELDQLAGTFGEGLQLVNILRDEHMDADDGRCFLPDDADRRELFSIAATDLDAACRYVGILETAGFDPGIVAFNALNTLLAIRTLALVREQGAGAKLGRDEVGRIVKDVQAAATARTARELLADAARGVPAS